MRIVGMALLLGIPLWGGHTLGVSGTRFTLDGQPFPLTGISFFNALYNDGFERDQAEWLSRFQKYGINTLRIWGQWDSRRGYVDTCPECTLYLPDGRLANAPLERLRKICAAADAAGMVIELTLFSQESWHDGIRLGKGPADKAVAAVTYALQPFRNVTFQIWNEFDERTLDHVKTIKAIDARRLVSNSPGGGGVFQYPRGEGEALDYLSPHTTRQGTAGRHWEIAAREVAYLLARYGKPVVDDEPARNGTPQFGGPRTPTSPNDHILQIWQMWQQGAYVIYHHDMFQMGKGHPTVPPSGVPDPEFNAYHRQVLEFIAQRHRYVPAGY